GPLEKGVRLRLFWIADPVSGQYSVVRLTDDYEGDAKRIQKAHRNFGADVSAQEVTELLRSDANVQDQRIRGIERKALGQPDPQARREEVRPGSPSLVNVSNVVTQQPSFRVVNATRQSRTRIDDRNRKCREQEETSRPRIQKAQWVVDCAGYGYADIQ